MSVKSTSSQKHLQKSLKAPAAKPKGTSKLSNKGTQPLKTPATTKSAKTQQLSQKVDKGHERIKNAQGQFDAARSRYESGKAAYEAIQEGRGKEHLKQVAVDKAKQTAYDKTIGRTPIASAKNLKNSLKDTVSHLKDGNFKDAVNSAKESVQNAKDTVTSTQALLKTKAGKKVVAKAGDTAAGKAVNKAVAKAAEHAVAKTATKVAAKAAARFVPGANVAMAVADAHHAYKVMKDPKASGWQKGSAALTALGSAAAATNIPVVSQVGAAVATVASIAEAVNPKKAFKALKGLFGN